MLLISLTSDIGFPDAHGGKNLATFLLTSLLGSQILESATHSTQMDSTMFKSQVKWTVQYSSINIGELRGNCDLTETCFLVNAIIQKAQFVRVEPFPMISEGNNCEVGR